MYKTTFSNCKKNFQEKHKKKDFFKNESNVFLEKKMEKFFSPKKNKNCQANRQSLESQWNDNWIKKFESCFTDDATLN